MANVINTLYPPMIANTFMPAFVNTENAIVYYSISPYNSKELIKKVHISLVDQTTNSNALKSPNGIIITDNLLYDESSQMYYVAILPSQVQNNEFKINQFYKVQLRFDTTTGDVPSDSNLGQYLIDNQSNFSEWSTVCLIKPISQPLIRLAAFDEEANAEKILGFNKGIIPISGKVYFGDNNTAETETLQSFSLTVLNSSDEVVLETPTVYTGSNLNPNEINYKLDTQSLNTDQESTFSLVIKITTNNQYTATKTYQFQIVEYVEDESFTPTVEATVDNDDGIVIIKIKNYLSVIGTLYVKRASSIDGFTNWENFYVAKINGDIDLELQDNTVGSMVWYRYSVQFENSKGGLTPTTKSEKVFPDFYDATLSRMETQVSIRYNFKISSFRPVVNRTKVDTLGGKYPKFVENAVLGYKQFSVSGLISSQEDYTNQFMTKRHFFGDDYRNYQVYVQKNDIDEYSDYLWEREFREELTKWLNDGEPKLFRSMTEGLMCVMLTDINLTPNSVLGRRLWDFSATVYEIADGTSLATLESLGIFDSGYSAVQEKDDGTGGEYVLIDKIGQIYESSFDTNNDVVNNYIFNNLEKEYSGVLSGKVPQDLILRDVKIYFLNEPNVFLNRNGNLELITKENLGRLTAEEKQRLQYGYVFSLNNSKDQIFVNKNGYFQIPSGIDVKSLYFPTIGDRVTLDYTITYKEYGTSSIVVAGTSVERTVVGQYYGVFRPNEYVGDTIRKRYSFSDAGAGYFEKMQRWKGISVDVTPYAVLSLQYKNLGEFKDYVVGEGGVFNILEGFACTDMCFKGKRMFKRNADRQPYLLLHEFVVDDTEYPNLEAIEPKRNTVYTINGFSKIWYEDAWYDFTFDEDKQSGIAAIDIYGAINYYGDVLRSDY